MRRSVFAYKVITALVCFAMIVGICIPSQATNVVDSNDGTVTDSQVIRVAYFDMGNYYTQDTSGNVISYDSEILDKMEAEHNVSFQYVDCGTWSNALKMLEAHQVDLVGTAQWTPQRETQYEYCLESYGYTIGELATLPDKKIIYEDYDAIGQAVIGCTYNYVRMNEMQKIFQEHGISPKIKTYQDQEDLEQALEDGEIDIIAANSHTLHDDWNVVEKFSFAPYFFISWKGNTQLTDMIDDALIKIQIQEPEFDDKLMDTYFPNMMGEPLTGEELELISEEKTYTIYYSTDIAPLSWYDEKNDTMQGALVNACQQIAEKTGLKLQVRPDWEQPDSPGATTVKFTTLFTNSGADISNEPGVTSALMTEPFNLYYKTGKTIELSSGEYRIAYVGKRNRLQDYLEEKYPNCTLIGCDSPAECVEKIRKGSVDLAYLSVHIADNELTRMGIDNIRELPTEEQGNGLALYFQGEDSEILASIVNKGIRKLDQTEITNNMLSAALNTQSEFSLHTLAEEHTGWFVTIIGIILAALLLIVFLVTYASVMKKQKVRVEKADADRSEFFARMSHDMRTPMNGILGMIGLSRTSNDIDEIHKNLDRASASGEYMLHLINDTLDLQKLESGKMKLTEEIVYTKDYFDDLFAMLQLAADKKHIDFRITNKNMNMDKYIQIDKIRVKQIFANLLSNAIKFTPEGGTVEVIMECLGPEDKISHKKFQIRDTGVGMSQEFIKNSIFKPYAQENNQVTSQLTGTGLGLAITKNLIETMGGHVEVESELGEGSTFTFYLDFKSVPEEVVETKKKNRKKQAGYVQKDLQDKNVLVCEDHPLNAEIARRLLEKVGCNVTWAEDGQKGVEAFAKSAPGYYDAILMDIRMPVMDGIQACEEIRQMDREDAPQVPIIAMTANAYESDKKKSYEAGMNAHLAKPVEPICCIGHWQNRLTSPRHYH